MPHKSKTLKGCKLESLDGKTGKIKDFYFDDKPWINEPSEKNHSD